jgi:hypothetical protein
MDIRKAILARMKELDITPSSLAREMQKRGYARSSIHRFIVGENSLNSETLGEILEHLKMTIKPQ